MTTEMEIAKQKRKAARATYSKTVNKLQEILAAESPDVDDLEIHLDQLTEKFKDLRYSSTYFKRKLALLKLRQLRQQSIKIYNTQPIKVDEIVLLEENNKRRSYWNLARVLKVIPSRDGQIRLALTKTEDSELLRPVQRLYRLELENPVVKTGDEPISLTTSSGRVVKTPAK
ncbi:integrase catalytic domain-containing protein [Nephila pilipes]|uniref:Integrase catalytic domain-containing protein n=1 Tax=Nephila pilipes TaxID=299642 RepID=A0A8X6TBP5_NEPPI|nr:integrase catalytic domain-containing protein [Nephila pilipes]